MSSATLRWAAASALLFACAPRSDAAGFAIFEQGARGMGFAGAYTAQAADGSAIFHNAAGVAFLRNRQLYFGGTLIKPGADFTGANPFPGESITEKGDVGLLIPPNAYYTQPINDRLAIGVGLHVPFGLETGWENPDTYTGRYISTSAKLKGFSLNPTIAYKLEDRLAVGVGLDVRFSSLGLERRVPVVNPFTQKVVDGAAVALDSDTNTGIGFNVGVLAKATESLNVGLSYRHKVNVDYSGTATFEPISTGDPTLDLRVRASLPQGAVPLKTSIEFPGQASFGFAKMFDRVDVRGRRELVPVDDLRLAAPGVRDRAPPGRDDRGAVRELLPVPLRPGAHPLRHLGGARRLLLRRDAVAARVHLAAPARREPQRVLPGRLVHVGTAAARRGRLVRARGRAVVGRTEPRPVRRDLQEPRAHAGRLARLHVLAEENRCDTSTPSSPSWPAERRRSPPRPARPISFTAYYSIGDSLAAGFESGSLVETHQRVSAPALIARQAGVTDFQLPLVSEPGIPSSSTWRRCPRRR